MQKLYDFEALASGEEMVIKGRKREKSLRVQASKMNKKHEGKKVFRVEVRGRNLAVKRHQ